MSLEYVAASQEEESRESERQYEPTIYVREGVAEAVAVVAVFGVAQLVVESGGN